MSNDLPSSCRARGAALPSRGSRAAQEVPAAERQAGPPGPQLALPALYIQTNAAAANQVSSYLRATNGNLSRKGSFMTTGKGIGAGLGSQSSLAFDARTQRFFAVNAGDNTISMLALDTDGS
jgi:hypothetical protein